MSVAAICMEGWAEKYWPECSDWGVEKQIAARIMQMGAEVALLAAMLCAVWLAIAPFPRWWYAGQIAVLLVVAVFGLAARY
ncbi:MAG TPA: hypothetical protein VFE24_12500 [Pirellulales bacterium]|nr:hypothetical protein [Pirellulales bacterium]